MTVNTRDIKEPEYIILDEKRLSELEGSMIPAEVIRGIDHGGRINCITRNTDTAKPYACAEGVLYPNNPSSFEIRWKLVLPYVWNGRSLQIGGGANNGHIPDVEGKAILSDQIPAELGFVVLGDDSGHQSESEMDASFAGDEESLDNYIRSHLIKTHDVMLYITGYVYGRKPVYNYFAGGSTGGREALECAISYGKDYDGIFCGDPASNYVLIRMWGAQLSKAVYDSYDPVNYPYSDGFIDEDTVKAIRDEAIFMYDELDGIKDGIIANIYAARSNREAFLELIRDKYALTDAQMHTIDVYENGIELSFSLPGGMTSYHGYSALEGGLMDLGPDPVPREPLDTRYNVHHGDRADGIFKYFIAKDPEWKLIDHEYLDPDKKLHDMLIKASEAYDCNGAELDDFISHGGKMIMFTSWNDMSISPWQIIQQYLRYYKKYGKETLDRFCRFYVMPEAGHCSGISMNYLDWLDRWCTDDRYPEETLYGRIHKTGGDMPMAEFPGWVRYVGGDPLEGKSYEISEDIPAGFFGKFD